VKNEPDPVELFEKRLQEAGLADRRAVARIHEEARAEADDAADRVAKEPRPEPKDVELHTYAASPVDAVYPGDYTGLP
jgi:2-oxoisovalerate dehydrogenase E1 component alpha subunit